MSLSNVKTAQQSIGAKFEWASATPDEPETGETLAEKVGELNFKEMFDVFEGDRPKLMGNSEKRDTYGGPLYFASSEDIETTEIKMPRKEGANAGEFDAVQTALKDAAAKRDYGTLKISVPASSGTRSEAFICQVLSFHEELEGPTGLQTVVVRLQGQKLQGSNEIGIAL